MAKASENISVASKYGIENIIVENRNGEGESYRGVSAA